MSAKWPLVKLGELLRLSDESITLIADHDYREVTVRMRGKGITLRGIVKGMDIASKQRRVVRPSQFLLARIDARQGACGIVPAELDGAVVTNDFMPYWVNEERLVPDFLGWLSKTEAFVEKLKRASEGTTNRVRIKEDLFLKLEIPLPPLAEQRRLVARIEAVAALVAEAQALRKEAVVEAEALLKAMKRDCFPAQGSSLVGDVVGFQTGYAFKSEWFTEEGIRLARNANVGHGVLDWTETVRIPVEQRKEYPRFELNVGDVLISLDRPIISTGVKVARVRPNDLPALLLQRVARAQMKTESLDQNYFFEWLRSPYFEEAIDPGRSNGVPHISHKDIEKITFTVPDLPTQRRIVRELDALQAQVDALKALQAETQAELDGLMGAVLGAVFGAGGINYQEAAREVRLAAEP